MSFGGAGSPQGWITVLVRSGIGYEMSNEAVDSEYIKSKISGENEMERVLNFARMKKVQMYALNRRQGFGNR
ncbi:MAG TPA: hypothetical protein C5S50_00905 [Methanosarcinaceae archaeon]|nr:hypothetical protein [Methanosarcinaceae archaeon]